jgi:cytochrome c
VLWIPYHWVTEPDRNLAQTKDLQTASIERGRLTTMPFSEENQFGFNCMHCHGPELKGGTVIQAGIDPTTGDVIPGYPANLSTVCGGPFTGHMLIWDVSDIAGTITYGRPAQGMPSWSIRAAGALDDQQINDLVNYLVWYSSKNVPFNENICLNPDAQKAAVAKFTANPCPGLYSCQTVIGPLETAFAAEKAKASASASPGASASPAGSASPGAAPSSAAPTSSASPATGSGS